MRTPKSIGFLVAILFPMVVLAQEPATKPSQVVSGLIGRILAIAEPPNNAQPRTFFTRLTVVKADGLPGELVGSTVELAYQAPDRLLLAARYGGQDYRLARNGQQIWIHLPEKRFGVIADRGVPRFAGDPDDIDRTFLPPFNVPLALKVQLLAIPMLSQVEARPDDTFTLELHKAIGELLKVPSARLDLVLPDADAFPTRIRFSDGARIRLEIELRDTELTAAWPAERWQLKPAPGDKVERVALSHVMRFAEVAQSTFRNRVDPLGPATGRRTLVASTGQGRLEIWDGTRVLFLQGTPEAMGRQHGTLLKRQVRDVVDRMLYGVGVGSSFAKGTWFFTEMEDAYRRLKPFMSDRHIAEIDAMADAAGISRYELRLANFFPELFHCTGFAVFGAATVDGRMYHGRILDYLRGVGLEQNAVVMVFQPDEGHAWVNIGYAGFVGSVTAMNEKHISIGEMGGRGEGNWDGKPMAQLVRQVMEEADTLEEAVEVFRKGPRTCEYYYVIADGKTNSAIAIEATPGKFVTVGPGQFHPQLPHPIRDAVLVSAGERYEKLVARVRAGYGKLDAAGARELMLRPVAMSSNIHSVLFAPQSLDFWVANADSDNPASHTRYTRYNLADLLHATPAVRP